MGRTRAIHGRVATEGELPKDNSSAGGSDSEWAIVSSCLERIPLILSVKPTHVRKLPTSRRFSRAHRTHRDFGPRKTNEPGLRPDRDARASCWNGAHWMQRTVEHSGQRQTPNGLSYDDPLPPSAGPILEIGWLLSFPLVLAYPVSANDCKSRRLRPP